MPSHAAEQHSKKQKNDSAEYPWGYDIPRRLLFGSRAGQPAIAGQVSWLPFLVRFWASKNEQIINISVLYLLVFRRCFKGCKDKTHPVLNNKKAAHIGRLFM